MSLTTTDQTPSIVCAPDSFKGSASAPAAAAAMARGARAVFPGAQITELPFADGGEGTLDALLAVWGTQPRTVDTVDALGRTTSAAFGLSPDGKTAVIEAAQANGLPQVSDVELQPERADTFGVGRIAAAALDLGVEEILLCIGGSASTDGGTGILAALGARFADAAGQPVAPGGGGLAAIDAVDTSGLDRRASAVRWRIAVDVDNPLTGPRGAAAVFGPQKGADADSVAVLDSGLDHLAGVLTGTSAEAEALAATPGFGAAGGIPLALTSLLGAEVVPGSTMVAEAVGLTEALADADFVLTGEGSFDSQSLGGKVVAAVRDHAPASAKVIVIAGRVGLSAAECRNAGITAALSIAPGPADLATLSERAEALIEDTTAQACALAAVGHTISTTKGRTMTTTTQTQLTIGDIAPDFTLTDAQGRTISKTDYAGRSVILYFYPKAASPGCTTEACDFRDNLSALAAAGFEVLGVSPDDTESLKEFAAEEGLTFSLLSDPGAAVARAYGSYGQKTIGEHTFQGTQRSTFVIGADGRLTHAEYNVDARGHVARLRTHLLP